MILTFANYFSLKAGNTHSGAIILNSIVTDSIKIRKCDTQNVDT
jgi:hypothetical protein